jgi:DNA-binding NtrC family response regulator
MENRRTNKQKSEKNRFRCAMIAPPPERMDTVPTPRPRIFVVDDDEVIATSLTAILKISGFEAAAFQNPLDALNAARVEAPDLLISEVVMPELSGIELALRFKEECPSCKVLLFSGQAATANLLQKARDQGHDFTLLSKPIHPTDLLREILRIME